MGSMESRIPVAGPIPHWYREFGLHSHSVLRDLDDGALIIRDEG